MWDLTWFPLVWCSLASNGDPVMIVVIVIDPGSIDPFDQPTNGDLDRIEGHQSHHLIVDLLNVINLIIVEQSSI